MPMKKILSAFFLFITITVRGQELFVFTEPASNMPAHSFTASLTDHFVFKDRVYGQFRQRFMPVAMFGVNKKIMLHAGITISNMHTPSYKYESAYFYAKYRFFSNDAVHTHFRMAVFTEASATKAPFHYEEIGLMGDKSGIRLGLIATQLYNRVALSATISNTELLDSSRFNKVIYIPTRLYQSINYSFSTGLLLFPRNYTSYKQTNVNLYLEWLGDKSLDAGKYCLDMAPAVQFIFNSNTKLNLGYRVQVVGNMTRMSKQNWELVLERTFLKK
jgi:hypothetical protein